MLQRWDLIQQRVQCHFQLAVLLSLTLKKTDKSCMWLKKLTQEWKDLCKYITLHLINKSTTDMMCVSTKNLLYLFFFHLLFTSNSLNTKIKICILICFPYSFPGFILWLLIWLVTINWRETTHFDSEDDYRTGCRNVSHCEQQQSYSGLRSPGRSNSTYFWNDSWVQTFHSFMISAVDSKQWFATTQQGSHVGWKNNKTFFPEFVLKQKTSHQQHM